jgi:lipoic acid synthetase
MSTSELAPEGRRLLRLEARNSQTPIERKPPWIKTRVRTGPQYTELQNLVKAEGLHTVCQEAGCPNIFECWEDREATFLIGGDQCTRRCDFCQIDTGKPLPLDRDEPRRVAESVAAMGLRYATVTGVARDDLPDGAAWLYAQTAREIHAAVPGCGVELLVPDFNAEPAQLAEVFSAAPEVFAHNLETVPRVFRRIRPGFRYERSLSVLRTAHEAGLVTKSNLILGLGETRGEIAPAMADLRSAGCDLLTITQYLRPSLRHHPVERWVKPEEFVELREEALAMGFAGVMSGPLVRSSYRAGRLYAQAIEQRATALPAPGNRRGGPGVSRLRSGSASPGGRPPGTPRCRASPGFGYVHAGWNHMLWVLVRADEGRLSRWLTTTALRTCRMPGG